MGPASPSRSADDVYDQVNNLQTFTEPPNAYEMKHTRLFCHPGNLKQKQHTLNFDTLNLLKNYGHNLISKKSANMDKNS